MDPMRSNSLGGHGYQGAQYRQSGLQYHRQPPSHHLIDDSGVGTNGFSDFEFDFMGPGGAMNGGLVEQVKMEGGSPVFHDVC